MRYVSTRVLPDPAPASTSSGPLVHSAASLWAGLRESRSTLGCANVIEGEGSHPNDAGSFGEG